MVEEAELCEILAAQCCHGGGRLGNKGGPCGRQGKVKVGCGWELGTTGDSPEGVRLTLQIGFLVINWGFDLASHCNVLRGWKSVAVEGEEFRHDQQEIGDLGKKQ